MFFLGKIGIYHVFQLPTTDYRTHDHLPFIHMHWHIAAQQHRIRPLCICSNLGAPLREYFLIEYAMLAKYCVHCALNLHNCAGICGVQAPGCILEQNEPWRMLIVPYEYGQASEPRGKQAAIAILIAVCFHCYPHIS